MPRSLKMATAAGDKASEINTRGATGLLQNIDADCRPCPAKPLPPGAGLFAPERSPCAAVDPWGNQAALARSPLVFAKAKSSQGVSASISLVSTVAPHQLRRPGGALR